MSMNNKIRSAVLPVVSVHRHRLYLRLGQLCERLAAAGGGTGLRLAAGSAGVHRRCCGACMAQKAQQKAKVKVFSKKG